MESDSDSDGSHISATPPRDHTPPPPPRPLPPPSLPPRPHRPSTPRSVRVSSFPTAISVPRKVPSKPTPRPTPNPLIQAPPKSDPPPPLPVEHSDHPGFSIKLQKPSDRDHMSSCASVGTFSSAFKAKRASFDPSKLVEDECKVGGGSGKDGDGKNGLSNNVVVNRDVVLKALPNWKGGFASKPAEQPKRLKRSDEGNFVRLNINGYGGKYRFRNWRKRGSMSTCRTGYRRRWRKVKPGVDDAGDGTGNGYLDEDGLVSDVSVAQKEKNCNWEKIDETISLVRENPSDQNLRKLLKLTHGYDSFRDGQLEAIRRVIAKQSTMVVLPTGAGKSLCYQLPALVLPGLTLVVSPLVALMVDQLHKLPPMIPGGLLCSSQAIEEATEILDRVHEGKIKVLYVSPERFSSAEFLSLLRNGPDIPLIVVDEAHCLSEWSHNFRPSYLRLRASTLRKLLKIDCFLAMTATATAQTLDGIMSSLEIESINLIQTCQKRDNLQLHVARSANRLKDLLMLMKSPPLCEIKSIIIYCKFQSETDMISKYLRDNNISSKSYHSGIPAKDRSHIQEQFCSNKIKVVVATVAFGMGLDKSDIGAVIHYSLPESLEEYVQETGRAGRDGRLSHCHLLLDDITYYKLRSFLYSDGTDEYAINRLLCEIFKNDTNLPAQISSMVKESSSRRFDMKQEVILTVLTQLELGDVQYLILYPQLNVTCSVYFHKTSPPLLAEKDSLVAAILEKSEMKQGHYVFDIPTIANSIRVEAVEVLNQLQNLKLFGEITYETKDPAFCFEVLRKPEDICSLTAYTTRWLSDVQSCKVWKLDTMLNIVSHAVDKCKKTDGCCSSLHTMCMQRKILDYFSRDGDDNHSDFLIKMKTNSPFLRADIKVFLQSNSFVKFTPRAVARIMHGIPSPAFPSANWSKCHFWGRYSQIDFPAVMEAARLELMNFVGKGEI